MSGALQGQTAVVTGSARGIGFAVATRLAQSGAAVALADLNLDRAEEAAARLAGDSGAQVLPVAADVADPKSVNRMVATVAERLGKVDILVNNAGIAGESLPVPKVSDAEWRSVLSIDLDGPFYCIRAVLDGMIERGYGRIVNIASIAGKEGNPNAAAYSAAKAGLIGLTKSVAKEVAATGVLVNCVTPAVIETELLEQVSAEHHAYMVSKIPMGRTGSPKEVAALVHWLCSPECSFSTGAVFDISGGRATY